MIPVQQTITEPPGGDCFRACVASVLEIPIDDLPNPHGPTWWDEWTAYLEPRGLTLWNFAYNEFFTFPGYWIADVDSPRGDFGHAVVMRGDELVWDPYPNGTGGGPPREATVIVPLDPATTKAAGAASTTPASPDPSPSEERNPSDAWQPTSP